MGGGALLGHAIQRDRPTTALKAGDSRSDAWSAGACVVVNRDVNAGGWG